MEETLAVRLLSEIVLMTVGINKMFDERILELTKMYCGSVGLNQEYNQRIEELNYLRRMINPIIEKMI